MSGRKMMGVTVVLALIFLFGLGFQAFATEIRIGVAMGLSGPPAIVDFAEAAMQGIKMAVKEYNTNGGCKGQPVKLLVYDDESNPKRAVEIATRLITHDKVVAMMGTVNSGNVLAFMHLNQQHRIPLMAGPSIASPITDRYQKEAKNYIFRGSMREEYQINAILDYAVKKSKKIALIHSTTGYGMFAREELVKGMKARGREFLAIEALTVGGGDSTSPMLKIKNAGSEVVLVFAEDTDIIGKVRSKLNYHPLIIGNWGLSGYKTFNLVGKPLICRIPRKEP
ncbi:MAG: ABC transporter substrate-binding protein, partial [Deltaproteobacteria bacterium]|nr:ABC transporter substrate-binding protein [Deltaproteobacteria bacterium]